MSKARKIRKIKVKAQRKHVIIEARRQKRARARALYANNTVNRRDYEEEYRVWAANRMEEL